MQKNPKKSINNTTNLKIVKKNPTISKKSQKMQ